MINWTRERLNWGLHETGRLEDRDGLTTLFVKLAEADPLLLEDPYIKNGTSDRSKGMENNELTALRLNS